MEKLNGKEIAKILDECYRGIDTLRVRNSVDLSKKIKWVLDNFNTTYFVARRIVKYANNFSSWYGYYYNEVL